ncbi:MAG TPA: outer membrane lipid asymmetry maintenance protein MlaD [Candidatus Deferrimicrobiaceae bacterium]|nr:outer membrane lipid asymmetry maintenance protein MlaD [Candidatus Deferrimicrobiaceae bacterium]
MKRFPIETAVGLFVLLGIACLAWLSVKLGKLEIVGGDYVPVRAEFSSVAGLKKGGSVEIAGVEVGKVEAITLNEYKADVLMKIRSGVRLQEDTIASIRTRGLIGDKFVNLSPGASDRMIPPGGKIRETEAAVDLEELIGEFIHGSAK